MTAACGVALVALVALLCALQLPIVLQQATRRAWPGYNCKTAVSARAVSG
ncbi:hypothetical protein [Actinomadura sp. 6N118]